MSLDRFLAVCGIGDIARDEDAGTAFLLDGALSGFGIFVLIEIADGDIGTFAGEQHRDGAANTGIGAGDQRHLVE